MVQTRTISPRWFWVITRKRTVRRSDFVPGGVSATGDDSIIYDIDANGVSAGGFGHPECSPEATTIGEGLPTSHPADG